MPVRTLKRLTLSAIRSAGYDVVKAGAVPVPVIEAAPEPAPAPEPVAAVPAPAVQLAPEPKPAPDPYLRYWSAERLAERPFLNLGAGSWKHPHWRNAEMMSEHYSADLVDNIDIHHDLMDTQPLAVPDNSIDAIFTSHTIEHLMTDDVDRMFAEAFRVLRPGGIIRITCPSIAHYHRAYLTGNRSWFAYEGANPTSTPLEHVFLTEFAGVLAMQYQAPHKKLETSYIRETLAKLPMAEALDTLSAHQDRAIARQWPSAHKSWWAPAKVREHLTRAGLNAYETGWGQSACPIMRLQDWPDIRRRDQFDTCVPWLSLFVEGVKGEHRRWDEARS